MVWFSDTFLDLSFRDKGSYNDSLKLELLDGYRIRIEMDNCPGEPDCSNCCTDHKDGDMYLARDLNISEVRQLQEACKKIEDKYVEYEIHRSQVEAKGLLEKGRMKFLKDWAKKFRIMH